jgi:hypothetical protein
MKIRSLEHISNLSEAKNVSGGRTLIRQPSRPSWLITPFNPLDRQNTNQDFSADSNLETASAGGSVSTSSSSASFAEPPQT